MATTTATDPERWRLRTCHGRQTWHYVDAEEAQKTPQSCAERHHLGRDTGNPIREPPKTLLDVARYGLDFFGTLQMEEGHWACEYGGPMFLLPGMVIACYVTHTPLPSEWRIEITRYLTHHAHKDDGGWGLHVEHHSTVFGTATNYVALRLLGMDRDHPVAARARATLHKMGGAIGIPQWGRLWLAVLNCYRWEGINPIPPELWLLPKWMPIHPCRWWVHTRNVYIPMSYLYAKRFQAAEDALIRSLREELYVEPFEQINFARYRNTCAPIDLYVPHSAVLNVTNYLLVAWESYFKPKWIQEKAIRYVYNLIYHEDVNSNYLCIGPVNKVLHLLAVWIEEGNSDGFKRHQGSLGDYLFLNKHGMMGNGTNGVQMWDTALLIQAAVDAGLATEKRYRPMLISALGFLEDCQIRHNCYKQDLCFRQQRKGAWPFSTRLQGYTVSDCTGEGIKATLQLQSIDGYPKLISDSRLHDAVDVLLTMQNPSGGFASYEPIRGPKWLEWFNAAEVFGNIMIEYDYPECTTAVLTALSLFQKHDPEYRTVEVNRTIEKALQYIRKSQREDGSWYGSWGICFTYATFFALEALASNGEVYENSREVQRACHFLLMHQEADGGWSESYKSCETGKYTRQATSQLTNTSWALLALMSAKFPDKAVIRRGIYNLVGKQQANGEWLSEAIEGVFNKNCMISYPNYKFYFPIRTIGVYVSEYGNESLAISK